MRALLALAMVWLLLPTAARAECDVPETGIAEEAVPS